MITSIKNYTTTKQNKTKKQKQTDRALGQLVKAELYRQNHRKKHTRIHSQKGKKAKKYISHCSQRPPPQFWDDSLSIQVFQRCSIHQVDCGDLIHCS